LKRTELYKNAENAPTEWQEAPQAPMKKSFIPKMKPLELLFAGSVAFFVLALIVAGFFFFFCTNTGSPKNVDIKISGTTETGAGSTVSLQVVITNRNAVPMQLTDLIVEFPEGTRSGSDITQELPRIRESLGTINPGQSVNRQIRAVLFGT